MRNPSSASASTSCKTPCCSKVGIKRGPWTPEEDEILANFVNKEGQGQWRTLPKRAGLLRCGKSCRLRWMNYLRPSVKRGRIAPDEEDLILRLHRLLGNRWSLIAGRIPGRTDNEIKNYWNTHLSKKLINQGIDPRTHKPLNPNFPSNCPKLVANGSDHINSSTVAKCPNPNPKPNNNSSNPNHNSSAAGGNPNDIQSQNPIADDHPGVGNIINGTEFESSHGHGNIEGYSTNELLSNEDNLSSFLDYLINEENGFGNNQVHHHHVVQETTNGVAPIGLNEPALPTPLFTENWDYYGGLSLEAELRYAMDTLGGDDDHHRHQQQSSSCHNINHTL